MQIGSTSTQAPASVQRRQFAACYSTFVVNGAVALSIGGLLPFIRDAYGLGYAFAGLLVSLHSVGNLISSFVAGLLPLWLGRRKSMLCFACMSTAAFLLLAFTGQPALLALAFLLTGLGRGAVSNFNNSVISEIAPGKAWALNALHATFAIGAFVCPLIILTFTKNPVPGWKGVCWFLVGCCVISLCIYARIPIQKDKVERAASVGKNLAFLRLPSFLLGTGTLFFYLCAEQGVIGWMVTYFKDSGLMSPSYAQGMASVLWVLILAGRLTVAWLSSRVRRSTLLCMMAAGFFGFFLVVLLGRTLPVITFGIAGFGFSMAGIYPTTVSLSGKTINAYPLAWSFMLTIAGCGSILMPALIGAVADSVGLYAGISTIVVAIGLAVCLILANAVYCRKTGEERG